MQIDYVEFATGDVATSKTFFAEAFGWSFTDYGPDYAEIGNAGLTGGLAKSDAATPPLIILKTDDLEAARESVVAAGGLSHRPCERPKGRWDNPPDLRASSA